MLHDKVTDTLGQLGLNMRIYVFKSFKLKYILISYLGKQLHWNVYNPQLDC